MLRVFFSHGTHGMTRKGKTIRDSVIRRLKQKGKTPGKTSRPFLVFLRDCQYSLEY